MQVEELDSPSNAYPPKTPPPNYGQATALPPKPRFASTTTLPSARLPPGESSPELDETTKQQLRAVFAACDDGRGLDAPRTREAVGAASVGRSTKRARCSSPLLPGLFSVFSRFQRCRYSGERALQSYDYLFFSHSTVRPHRLLADDGRW